MSLAFAVPSWTGWSDPIERSTLGAPLDTLGYHASAPPSPITQAQLPSNSFSNAFGTAATVSALAFSAAALVSGRRRLRKRGVTGHRPASAVARRFAEHDGAAMGGDATTAVAEDLSFAALASDARKKVEDASSGLLSSFYDAADSVLSRSPQTEEAPSSIFSLAANAMQREVTHLVASCENTPLQGLASTVRSMAGMPATAPTKSPFQESPPAVKALTLSGAGVHQRELERGTPATPFAIWALFRILSWTLDQLYEGRPIARLWALETIARIPYFAFGTALQLYESLGWWRTPNLRDVHHAEEANELHHLLIMEALGGNAKAFDRFFAHNAAVLYYWATVALYMVSPTWAYNFSHLVEEHAYVTYSQFVVENEERLRRLPPPPVAKTYYRDGDLYQFDKFHTQLGPELPPRRPPCDNLLDVFRNVRDDEAEHIATISALERWTGGDPNASICGDEEARSASRQAWLEWSREINGAPALA